MDASAYADELNNSDPSPTWDTIILHSQLCIKGKVRNYDYT
jgi:hypothetical protein